MKPFSAYQNPALAVDVAIFGYSDNGLSVLLLNRKEEPFKDQWTLPGVFVQMDEQLATACTRVLQTKLGISKVYLEQLFTFDDPARDPRGRVVAVAYYALINPAKVALVAGSMANDVKWYPVKKLPRLGFDHKKMFMLALQRLRSKILYFPVGFELLDDQFTMPELHQLYECILQTTIDRRNFSRKILEAGFVVNTGTKRAIGQSRHPDLYRFNSKLKQNSFNLHL